MRRRPAIYVVLLTLMALLLVPSATSAQTAEIAGVVRDSSGGVLPGVTVEASSPALIERSRTVFADSQGQYRVIALSPGEYTVTFTLAGFRTIIREGIVLTAAFTANVNVEMAVGGIEESVTVSGQSPLVDVQATTQRRALTSELIDQLPTGRSFQNLAILVPGVQVPLLYQDVGGSDGARWQTMKIHGSRDDQMPLLLNGMPFNNMNNTGGGYNHTLAVNTGTVEEMTVETSGLTAEVATSGVVANTLAKEGSNRFSYYFYSDYVNSDMQSSNLSQDLIDRGLEEVNRVKEITEVNPAMGGPIVRDRLWFYGGFRYLRSQKYIAGTFEPRDPSQLQYCRTPAGCNYPRGFVPDYRDLTRQAFSGDRYHRSYTANLTWQASPRNKANFFWHLGQRHLDNDPSVTNDPSAATFLTSTPDYVLQARWANPVTSRLLLEGGMAFFNETWWWLQQPHPGITVNKPREIVTPPGASIAKLEQSLGTLYGAAPFNAEAYNHQYNMRFALNYVTGTHAFKFGVTQMWGTRNYVYNLNAQQLHLYLNGSPLLIIQYAYPLEDLQKLRARLGLYAQDRWTLGNLTLNLGLRFDFHNAYIPAQNIAALQFVPAKDYAALEDTPSWKDLSPRAGFAWDITGEAKSVVRFNYGHYLASESVASATANNPVNTRINNAFRLWLDPNGNFIADCDLKLATANGECGALSAPLGNPGIVTHWDPAILRGWGARPNDDEILVGFQQQLTDRLSADVQWTRHWFGNFFVRQHRATPPEAYDSYCITAPRDARLPGGGGNQICGFMDIKPTFFGVTPDTLVTSASNFGDVDDVFTGLDVTVTARFPNGGVASGGVSAGREGTDFCAVIGQAQMGSNAATSAGLVGETNVSSYPSTLYCRVQPPYQPDWKAFVTYPLPWWGLHASAAWQNRPGPEILASHVITSAATNLGRPLSAGSATVNLIAPGTLYDDRVNQLDFRLSRILRIAGGGRIQPHFALYNLFNANPAITLNTRYGPAWLTPTRILQSRLLKIGVQMDF